MSTAVRFHILKYSSRQELAEANPYPMIWEFTCLKFSLIILTCYVALMCPQSCYVVYLTWLLHDKRLTGSAEEI